METDWSKVFEVFGSGIIGVYLVMILLMILTQFSNWIIGRFEQAAKGSESEQPK
jgi:hypothetical protein